MASSVDDRTAVRKTRVCIGLLLALHAGVGIAAVKFTELEWLYAIVAITQPALLAMGIVLPYRCFAFRICLACVALPVVVLLAQLAGADGVDDYRPVFVVFFVFPAHLLPALAIRLAGGSIRQISVTDQVPPPFRFSIAQLMLATAVIALIIVLPQWWSMRWTEEIISEFISLFFEGGTAVWIIMLLVSYPVQLASLAVIQFTALWAALRPGRLLPHLIVALTVILFAGLMPKWYLYEEIDWLRSAGMSVFGIAVFFSLLFVRSCSYRLVRSGKNRLEATPACVSRSIACSSSSLAERDLR